MDGVRGRTSVPPFPKLGSRSPAAASASPAAARPAARIAPAAGPRPRTHRLRSCIGVPPIHRATEDLLEGVLLDESSRRRHPAYRARYRATATRCCGFEGGTVSLTPAATIRPSFWIATARLTAS